jgi:hypothetical protein
MLSFRVPGHHMRRDVEFAVRDRALVSPPLHGRYPRGLGRIDDEFAKDGVCAKPCPPLAGFKTEEAQLVVTGPAETSAGLK